MHRVSARIQKMTASTEDVAKLFNLVFSSQNPRIVINTLESESERSAQRGFLNLLTGIHGHFRNPRAHATHLGADQDRAEAIKF